MLSPSSYLLIKVFHFCLFCLLTFLVEHGIMGGGPTPVPAEIPVYHICDWLSSVFFGKSEQIFSPKIVQNREKIQQHD